MIECMMNWWGWDEHTYHAIRFIASSSSSSSSRGTTYSRITPFYQVSKLSSHPLFETCEALPTLFGRRLFNVRLSTYTNFHSLYLVLSIGVLKIYENLFAWFFLFVHLDDGACKPCLITTPPCHHLVSPCNRLLQNPVESSVRKLSRSFLNFMMCSLTARAGTSRCTKHVAVIVRTCSGWFCHSLRGSSPCPLCARKTNQGEHQWERVRKKEMKSRFVPPRVL